MKHQTIETPKRGRPDFTGVPGELVLVTSLPPLEFSTRKRHISPYDALLDQLATAGPDHALKFGSLRPRASLTNRAKKCGILIAFAEKDNFLYVKFLGRAEDASKEKRKARILQLIRQLGPCNPIKLAARMREEGDASLDAIITELILAEIAKTGQVIRRDDNTWNLNPSYKTK